MKSMIFLSMLCLVVFKTYGQLDSTINLKQALDISARQYPFLKAKLAEKNLSEEYLKAAKTAYIPDVIVQNQFNMGTDNGVNGSYTPIDGPVPTVSGGIRKNNIFQPIWGSLTSLQVNWNVFTFGKIQANINVAQKASNLQDFDYQNEVFQQKVRVADAYLNLLVFQKVVNIQKVNLERALTFQTFIIANVSSGLKAGIDSSVANAEVSKAKILLLQSQQNEKLYSIKLAELIGFPKGEVKIDSSNFYKLLPETLDYSQYNVLGNPSLKRFQSQIEYSNARVEAIQRSYYPNLVMNGTFWGRGSGINNATGDYSSNMLNGLNYQVSNYLLGLGLRWNLSSIVQIRHLTKAENFRVNQYQELYNQNELTLTRQSESADAQIQLAKQQALEAPIQINAARDAYRQATARYQSGLATLPELFQTYTILNRAEVDKSVAINNVWRALLIKSAALGDLDFFLNQIK